MTVELLFYKNEKIIGFLAKNCPYFGKKMATLFPNIYYQNKKVISLSFWNHLLINVPKWSLKNSNIPQEEGKAESSNHSVSVSVLGEVDHQSKMREQQDEHQITEITAVRGDSNFHLAILGTCGLWVSLTFILKIKYNLKLLKTF